MATVHSAVILTRQMLPRESTDLQRIFVAREAYQTAKIVDQLHWLKGQRGEPTNDQGRR